MGSVLWLVVFCVLLLWPAPTSAQRVALVIGNGDYRSVPPLANPPHDARAISGALRTVGFEVDTLADADRPAMTAALRRLSDAAVGAEVAVLYYAGHAVEVGGRNMLLPVGVRAQATDIQRGAISFDEVERHLEGRAAVTLVFLDACRDNPFGARRPAAGLPAGPRRSTSPGEQEISRSVGGGLAGVASASGMVIAFATAPGRVALDGAGNNSPFATALLEHLVTPDLEVRQMLGRVRRSVREATAGRQIPWDNSSLEGEFFFRSSVPLPTARRTTPHRTAPPSAESATPPQTSPVVARAPVDPSPQRERPVGGDDVARRLIGNTMEYEGTEQRRVRQHFLADGRAFMSFGGVPYGVADFDWGRWEVRQNEFCVRWSRWRQGQRYCLRAFRDGEAWYVVRTDDRVRADVSVRRGDPYGLYRWW